MVNLELDRETWVGESRTQVKTKTRCCGGGGSGERMSVAGNAADSWGEIKGN